MPAAVEIYNPYKGLQAFQEADADDFYGRESMIQQLVNRMAQSRFLAVVGPSGSGKSSLVKAGLIPALRQGALPGSEKWFVAEMTPGTHPLEELELALLPIAVNPPPSLLEPLQKDERGLLRTIRRVLPDEAGAELLLVIDQFEELFTLVEDNVRRRHFLDSLLAALQAHRSPLRVVLTLRADFYDRPLQIQPIAELFRQHAEIVVPLSQEELTWAIREPARRVGVGLEEGVVTAIVADVAGQAGTLPQVQYTLTELFDERQDNVMTLAAYQALGGVSGALGQRAEELYAQLDQVHQETTRQLFLRLVTLGEGVEDTRRRVRVAELEAVETEDSKSSEVLDAYGRYRLLTFDRDPLTREPTAEVAHEALLREWPRLRRWLEQSRDDVRLQRRLAAAAKEWEQAGRKDGYLLRGSRLDLFAGWATDLDLALTRTEQDFLAASIADRAQREAAEQARQQRELETAQQLAQTEKARAEEQGRSARRLRILAAGLAAILLLAIGAAYVAVDRGQAARASADQAATSEAAAVVEASERATAEAGAVEAREQAEEQALLARSRELAAASVSRLATDPELSLLLAIEALSVANTTQGENALHAAVLGSRVRQRFTASDAWLCGVTYSPDGSLLALTDEEGKATLWNAATGTRLFEVSTKSSFNSSSHSGFNQDASRLAIVDPTDALTVSFWDTASGQPVDRRSLPATTAGLTNYSIHPELTQIAVGYENGAAEIWDLVNNELVGNLAGHTGWIEPFHSSNGRRLATAGLDDQSVLVWEAATATLLHRLNTEGPAITASVSPDGRWLAVSVPGPAVKIWDLAAPNEGPNQPPSSILTEHANFVFGLAFSPDSRLIATASRDGTARIWNVATSEELLMLPHGVGACAIAFHPDGNSVVTGDSHGAARVWDIGPLGSAERLLWKAHDDVIRGIALSPGRDHLATIGGNIAKIWDPATGRELQLLRGHDARILSVAYHPDGKRLATAGADGTTRVWDGVTGQELLRLEGHSEGLVGGIFAGVLGVNFSPDGSRLATAGADGTARVWDADTGQELLLLKAYASGLTNVVFSPDGRYLATSSDEPDATVRLWDAGTGEELFALPPSHGDRVWGLDFTPDGRFLATSGGDTTAKIWRLDYGAKHGELLATLTGHTNTVGNVRFAPDGQSLATTGEGENVRIWDVSALYDSFEGEAVPELLALTGGGWGIAFNPERRELVTAASNGVVRTYLLDSDELLALARSRLTRTWTAEECRQYRIEPCPSDT